MTNQEKVEKLVKNLKQMAYNDYHIHAGTDRRVTANLWQKDDKKRTYIDIRCCTGMGHLKRVYKCGYVDMITGDYIVGKYDDVNAETSVYLK